MCKLIIIDYCYYNQLACQKVPIGNNSRKNYSKPVSFCVCCLRFAAYIYINDSKRQNVPAKQKKKYFFLDFYTNSCLFFVLFYSVKIFCLVFAMMLRYYNRCYFCCKKKEGSVIFVYGFFGSFLTRNTDTTTKRSVANKAK